MPWPGTYTAHPPDRRTCGTTALWLRVGGARLCSCLSHRHCGSTDRVRFRSPASRTGYSQHPAPSIPRSRSGPAAIWQHACAHVSSVQEGKPSAVMNPASVHTLTVGCNFQFSPISFVMANYFAVGLGCPCGPSSAAVLPIAVAHLHVRHRLRTPASADIRLIMLSVPVLTWGQPRGGGVPSGTRRGINAKCH